MGFLAALIPLLAGITSPIKGWFAFKSRAVQLEQEVKLATIKAQAEQVVAEARNESSQVKDRLGATSREFKQTTFWLLYAIVIFSIVLPSKAEVMWHNFALMPEWFQWLFMSVYSAIWGLPIVKGGYGAITDLLQQRGDKRRNFEIEKLKVFNQTKFFDSLRHTIFKKGLTEAQVEDFKQALMAGDEDSSS